MSKARPTKKSVSRVLAKPAKPDDVPAPSAAPQKPPRAVKPTTLEKSASRRKAPTDLELAAAVLDETDTSQEAGISIGIPSRAEYVRVVRLALLGVASRMPFSYDDVEDIKLAVSEACNNAILHADDNGTLVQVLLTPHFDRLEIEVTDGGRVPPPGLVAPRHKAATPSEELRESGLGLFLMQTLMDEVQHATGADADTKVRLVKYLPGSPHRKTAV